MRVLACVFTVLAFAAHGRLAGQTYQAATLHTFQPAEGTSPSALVKNPDGSFTGLTNNGALGSGSVFRITTAGTLTVLHNMTAAEGAAPYWLTVAADGTVYGVAYNGGGGACAQGCGTVFRVASNGTFTVLYTFTGGADGANPGALFAGADGALYGAARYGGSSGNGTIFRLPAAGGAPTVLYTFCTVINCSDGWAPASLIAGQDGNLYGTTLGTSKLFRLTPGGAYSVVKQFIYDNGSNPDNLLQAPDGSFFFTFESDPYGSGRIAQLTTSGQLNILRQFYYTDGGSPFYMNWGADGSMYGVARSGGDAGSYGIAFRVTQAGAVSTLFSFSNVFEGGSPLAIQQGDDSLLYGAAAGGGVIESGLCNTCGTIFQLRPVNPAAPAVSVFSPAAGPSDATVTVSGTNFTGATDVSINGVALPYSVVDDKQISASITSAATTGQITVTNAAGTGGSRTPFEVGSLTYQTLYRFCPGGAYPSCPDGIAPNSLFVGRDGNFYGTSDWSGAVSTLFRITPTGQLTTIASNLSQPNPVVQARDGNFYGSTPLGGYYGPGPCYTTFPEPPTGCGYVFKVTPAGQVTTLYRFKGFNDGGYPSTNMVQGADGGLYGATDGFGKYGNGNIFRISPLGVFTPVFGFSGTDGRLPNSLTAGSNALYGTTAAGGTGGKGTVFRLNSNATLNTLYNFSGTDGDTPNSLVVTSSGIIFGSTQKGGPGGAGVVFKIDAGGTYLRIYAFSGVGGANPVKILLGRDGNLYGILSNAGPFGGGSVFRLTMGGQLTVLYSFVYLYNSNPDGFTPTTLVQTTGGALWGTTASGGDASCYSPKGCGVFFKLQE